MGYLDRAKSVLRVRREAAPEGQRGSADPPVGQSRCEISERSEKRLATAQHEKTQGQQVPCPHRPPGEIEERWERADGAVDLFACGCCGGPVLPSAWVWEDGLCPVCRDGHPYAQGSGHLVRLALDLGAKELRP